MVYGNIKICLARDETKYFFLIVPLPRENGWCLTTFVYIYECISLVIILSIIYISNVFTNYDILFTR